MAAGYDGTIKIDTSVNARGMNSGVKSIGNAFGNILKSVKTIGSTLAKAFSVGALVLFSASIGKVISTIRESMGELLKRSGGETMKAVQDIQDRFGELKLAVANAFLPLIIAALPYIKMVISWLIKAMNYLSMFFAAMVGQKQVLQVVEGSTKSTAENLKDTATEAKKALGALAGFDQINVLDTQQADATTASGPDLTDAVTTATEMVPITDDILSRVVKIKEWFLDAWTAISDGWNAFSERWKSAMAGWGMLWDWIKTKVGDFATWFSSRWTAAMEGWGMLWEWIKLKVGEFADWFSERWNSAMEGWGMLWDWIGEKLSVFWATISQLASDAWIFIVSVWQNAGEWFSGVWESVSKFAGTAWNFIGETANAAWTAIKSVWSSVTDWFKAYVVEPIKAAFSAVWTNIGTLAGEAWTQISGVWANVTAWFSDTIINPLVGAFTSAWDSISGMASDAWAGIKDVFGAIGSWLSSNVGDPLRSTFGNALDWVQEKWQNVFDAISSFVTGVINTIIGGLNGLLEGATIGINGLIDGANLMGSIVPGWVGIPTVGAPQIPYLATGAVIPPNSQFLAVLGDQKSGRNIEAPEDLIRKIVREESGTKSGQTITIKFDGTFAGLVREMKPYIDKENSRIGGTLIS